MNIFHLHKDPVVCAQFHCDKHVVKMIVETAQMLSTAYRKRFDDEFLQDDTLLYKSAFPHHPMTIWVGETGGNFRFTFTLLGCLLCEYMDRYDNVHSTTRIWSNLDSKLIKWRELSEDFTTPPLCMPDEYKCDNYIDAYRNYYIGEKKKFATYKNGNIPGFMK
jgi:hypothetical protein